MVLSGHLTQEEFTDASSTRTERAMCIAPLPSLYVLRRSILFPS